MSSYFIAASSGQEGPFSLDELKSKNISKDVLVWREGMKDWVKAGELDELKFLFAPAPPPLPKQKPVGEETSQKTVIENTKEKKNVNWLLPAIVIAVVAAGAIFYFARGSKKQTNGDKHLLALSDSVKQQHNDSTSRKDTTSKKDTTKTVNLDSLSGSMQWGDTSTKKPTNSTTDTTHSLLPGVVTPGKNPGSKKPEKKPEKKPKKQTNDKQDQNRQNQNQNENQNQNNTPPTEKINPARSIEISGSFHKNLLLDGVVDGTIYNRSKAASFSNIVIEVRYIDNNGNTVTTKEFTQPGVLHQGQNVSFKFKADVPYRVVSARYSVASAKVVD